MVILLVNSLSCDLDYSLNLTHACTWTCSLCEQTRKSPVFSYKLSMMLIPVSIENTRGTLFGIRTQDKDVSRPEPQQNSFHSCIKQEWERQRIIGRRCWTRGDISENPPSFHTPGVCHDLNLVNTLKSYYDHISRAVCLPLQANIRYSW